MRRNSSHRSFATAASMLLAIGVAAWPVIAHADKPVQPAGEKAAGENKPSTEAKPKAEVKAEKVEAKTEAKIDKLEKKAEATKPGDPHAPTSLNAKAAEPGERANERATRKLAQREAQREQLRTALKGPMTEAMRQELRRHAQRVARIERIKSLAVEQKDKDTTERADKLLAKENERHDKWMAQATKAGATPAAAGTPVGVDPNAKVEVKGGAR